MALHRRMFLLTPPAGTIPSPFVLLILVAALSMSTSARADTLTRPFWTEQAMFQFADDIFFVGQSSCARTSEQGRQEAFAYAMQEILNYAQATNASGLPVETQMVFEEVGTPGCMPGTVTVWRLLRVDAARLSALNARTFRGSTVKAESIATALPHQMLSVGMSRDEVFNRFGLPASMTMRPNNESTWEYRRFGLSVNFDRNMFVKGWVAGGKSVPNPPTQGLAMAGTRPSEAPALDLTARLRQLEQSGTPSRPDINTVYNAPHFVRRSTAIRIERTIDAHETSATGGVNSPHSDSFSDKISQLWTCRTEDGRPSRNALMQTRHGLIVNPTCVSPWNQ